MQTDLKVEARWSTKRFLISLRQIIASERTGSGGEQKKTQMRSFLGTKDVYFEFTRPDSSEDDVPVQLKNNAYSKLFEPVTEMFALPQYRELDLTPFLAPFFMLFFGMCMGDGGYGLIIWLACFIIGRKASPSVKGYLVLGQYLGIMTVIVGLLTGSFFGIALDSVEWPWLAGVKSLFLTEANYGKYLGGYNPMMIIAVAVGIIQILYGMCLNAARLTKQFGFKYAVSTLGWVVAIILLGVLYRVTDAKSRDPGRFEIRALRFVGPFCVDDLFLQFSGKRDLL